MVQRKCIGDNLPAAWRGLASLLTQPVVSFLSQRPAPPTHGGQVDPFRRCAELARSMPFGIADLVHRVLQHAPVPDAEPFCLS